MGHAYDCYHDDIILDIQDAIGYTPGGFPLAPYEQITKWTGGSEASGSYPFWIRRETGIKKENLFIEKKEKSKNRLKRKRGKGGGRR